MSVLTFLYFPTKLPLISEQQPKTNILPNEKSLIVCFSYFIQYITFINVSNKTTLTVKSVLVLWTKGLSRMSYVLCFMVSNIKEDLKFVHITWTLVDPGIR